MEHETLTAISIRKRRIALDQRMAAKALLLESFSDVQSPGQLIIHFGPGRNALFVEWQERADSLPQQLSFTPLTKTA